MAISSADIVRAEQRLGGLWPAQLKDALLVRNGRWLSLGGEDWRLFPLFDASSRDTMRRTANDIVRATVTARKDGLGFPPDGLAIGSNDAGDLLLLRLSEAEPGDVWILRLRGGELHPTCGLSELLKA